MSRKDDVLVKHRKAIRETAVRHKANSIALVGSVARDEDGAGSDYDFLVEFAEGTGLFDMARLKRDLEDLLGDRVDVVSVGGLKRCRSMLDDAITL